MVRLPFPLVFKHSLHISQRRHVHTCTVYVHIPCLSLFHRWPTHVHSLLTSFIPSSFSVLHTLTASSPGPFPPPFSRQCWKAGNVPGAGWDGTLMLELFILYRCICHCTCSYMLDISLMQVHWLEGYVGCRAAEGASCEAPPEPSTGHDEPCSSWDLPARCQGEHGIPHQYGEKVRMESND